MIEYPHGRRQRVPKHPGQGPVGGTPWCYVIVAGTLSGLAAVPAAEGLPASFTRLLQSRPALRRSHTSVLSKPPPQRAGWSPAVFREGAGGCVTRRWRRRRLRSWPR
jgi:hypothetical protein